MRTGFTTGSCAAAAAKGAALLLTTGVAPESVEIGLPSEETRISLPLLYARMTADGAESAVRKDAGDDPDITDGVAVVASVAWNAGEDVIIRGGEGVGVVTKPGLSVPPGEAAINPVPRRMIAAALREVTDRGAVITIAIPGGEDLAARTFNPRLGIRGGLSILGTSGRVRPFSCPALKASIRCLLDVAVAGGVTAPVLVPGHIGARAARRHFRVGDEQIIEVGNEWGTVTEYFTQSKPHALLVVGHPGKLAKLAMDQWQTHSSQSKSAVPFVTGMARDLFGSAPDELPTVDGVFSALDADERASLGGHLAGRIGEAVRRKIGGEVPVAVVLVNMQGHILGSDGDTTPWR